MSSNMKAFSLTHIMSIFTGMTVAIVWTAEFFHTIVSTAWNTGVIFVGALVPIAYAPVLAFYAYALKATATGIQESTTAPKA